MVVIAPLAKSAGQNPNGLDVVRRFLNVCLVSIEVASRFAA